MPPAIRTFPLGSPAWPLQNRSPGVGNRVPVAVLREEKVALEPAGGEVRRVFTRTRHQQHRAVGQHRGEHRVEPLQQLAGRPPPGERADYCQPPPLRRGQRGQGSAERALLAGPDGGDRLAAIVSRRSARPRSRSSGPVLAPVTARPALAASATPHSPAAPWPGRTVPSRDRSTVELNRQLPAVSDFPVRAGKPSPVAPSRWLLAIAVASGRPMGHSILRPSDS